MNVNGASRLDGGAVFRFMPMLAKAGRTSTPGRSAFATVALLWLIGLGEERRGREHRDVGHPEPAPVNGRGMRAARHARKAAAGPHTEQARRGRGRLSLAVLALAVAACAAMPAAGAA